MVAPVSSALFVNGLFTMPSVGATVVPGVVSKLAEYLGEFHPMVVHFPIALLLVAAIGEVVNVRRRSPRLAWAVGLALAIGSLTACVAVILGWLNAAFARDIPQDALRALFWHRWLGVAVAALSVLALVSDMRGRAMTRRIVLILAALLVAITGYLGGELVYGVGHLAWPS